MKRWAYEIFYRFASADIVFGSNSKIEKLAKLAVDGRVAPGKAITLGCGEGRETIFLAKRGFDVLGVDFSPTAIKKARRRANAAGVEVSFIIDDLTNLTHYLETFDLVMDFGALNDMSQEDRQQYMKNVLPLTYPGSYYIMFCFDKMLPHSEVAQRFDDFFQIEVLHKIPGRTFPGTLTLYSMTRKEGAGG